VDVYRQPAERPLYVPAPAPSIAVVPPVDTTRTRSAVMGDELAPVIFEDDDDRLAPEPSRAQRLVMAWLSGIFVATAIIVAATSIVGVILSSL